MYRDNNEALRARVDTLEAELLAAERRCDAAQAQARAADARLRETELLARSGVMRPSLRLAWPVLLLTALGAVSTLYLGRSWSQQWRVTRRVHLENMRLRHDIAARDWMFLNCERMRRQGQHADKAPAASRGHQWLADVQAKPISPGAPGLHSGPIFGSPAGLSPVQRRLFHPAVGGGRIDPSLVGAP